MNAYSSSEAAKKLGITAAALSKYIKAGKVPTPSAVTTGKTKTYIWTDDDIERVRKLLPKLANGRKTRYQKQESEARSQEPVKTKSKTKKQPQPGAAVPHKQRRKKH